MKIRKNLLRAAAFIVVALIFVFCIYSIATHAAEKTYTDDDLYIMEHVICGECNDSGWDMKISVGSVVLNRVADERFPNTIAEVVFQQGQYACTWDGNYCKEPNEETKEAAKYLLENGSQIDESVVWQAEFVQGRGIYDVIDNMYFCY